uniref:Appr-1-p processing domain protein n=1 Tax=Variovorax paradoxus (strain S110) TaxID=543728 RepID=C5CL32_VARPS
MKVEVVIGNIASQPDAQAVVNSANANLRRGSGVAGAIHAAAGAELEAYCRPLAPLVLGGALTTPGFGLPSPRIIQVRAPDFLNNDQLELHYERAILSMMDALRIHRIASVAIPAIGIGVFRFPPALAASIMARVRSEGAAANPTLRWVRIYVTSEERRAVSASAFGAVHEGQA